MIFLKEKIMDAWIEKWNTKFSTEEYAYGKTPNLYLAEKLENLPVGKILCGAEGEGRNAVYAAKKGWEVAAFDISEEGRKKAMRLAKENQVEIDYKNGLLPTLGYKPQSFDAIALIYAHFPKNIRETYHKLLDTYLKSGGYIILEAFRVGHEAYQKVNPNVGGPQQKDFLLSEKELKETFSNYEIIELLETETMLNEGDGHIGKGGVVRFLGKKM